MTLNYLHAALLVVQYHCGSRKQVPRSNDMEAHLVLTCEGSWMYICLVTMQPIDAHFLLQCLREC